MLQVYGLRGCRGRGWEWSLGAPSTSRKLHPKNVHIRDTCMFRVKTRTDLPKPTCDPTLTVPFPLVQINPSSLRDVAADLHPQRAGHLWGVLPSGKQGHLEQGDTYVASLSQLPRGCEYASEHQITLCSPGCGMSWEVTRP
eukprot:1157916-Pelagomonas_calceolata.AAC.2